MISARKAKHLTSQPCLHTLMQTLLSRQSERACYLSYFIKRNIMEQTQGQSRNLKIMNNLSLFSQIQHLMKWNLLSAKQIGHTLILMNYKYIRWWLPKLLENLNPNKSMGPDQIHLGVLKQHATAVALILTVICNKSPHSGEVPKTGGRQMLLLSLRKANVTKQKTIIPLHLLVLHQR